MEEYSEKPKKRGIGRKILTTLSIILVLAAAGFVFFKFFYVFGSGVKAGELNLFVYKGYVFKTYEGRLIQAGYNSQNSNQICGRQRLFCYLGKRISRYADFSAFGSALVASRNLQFADFHFVVFRNDFNPSVVLAEPLVLRTDAEQEGFFFLCCCDGQHETAVFAA